MVEYLKENSLDDIFSALSDRTRRSILTRLAADECTVSELAAPHGQSVAGISKHLIVLEKAGLITKTRRGRVVSCSAKLEVLSEIAAVLEALGSFWRERLEALENLVSDSHLKLEKKDGSDETGSPKRSGKKDNPRDP